MISSILAALEIIAKIPNAAEAISQIGLNLKSLIAAKEQEIVPDTPLGKVINGERKKLDDLVDKYYRLDQDERYDEVEKNEHRKRIAAQVCALLKGAEPIKDGIIDYDKLRELFCQTFPDILVVIRS
jgi:hypothetical protein